VVNRWQKNMCDNRLRLV